MIYGKTNYNKAPYIKVYNSENFSKATKVARIDLKKNEYVTGHHDSKDE